MKTAIIATLQLGAAMLLCSCSTVYHAPDAKKLNASATKLKKAIVKSHDTAKRAKTKHEQVEHAANVVVMDSLTIDDKIKHLSEQAPPELQPLIKDLQDVRKTQQAHEDALQQRVEEETQLHIQLAKDNTEVTSAKTDWDQESQNYQTAAAVVADTATKDNAKLRGQLWHQKLLKWLGFGGLGLFLVVVITIFVLWKAGKLYLKVKP